MVYFTIFLTFLSINEVSIYFSNYSGLFNFLGVSPALALRGSDV